MTVWKRASTPAEKSVIMHDLETSWNVPADLRLGQLIVNAVSKHLKDTGQMCNDRAVSFALFYMEDEDLRDAIDKFVNPPTPSTTSA